MKIKNFEFKVKVNNLESYENQLLASNPLFIGMDHQTDTYFKVSQGRLKLREGNIENALIHYDRENVKATKEAEVILYEHQADIALKEILSLHLGILVVVQKKRKIYFIQNVKFHFDDVFGLGKFIEVEAIDKDGTLSKEELKEQCSYYFNFFKFQSNDLLDKSYSDMLMEKQKKIV